MYTVLGMSWLVGFIVLKVITIFMNKSDKTELSKDFRSFKPNKKDWE